jgi:hypothetical protein
VKAEGEFVLRFRVFNVLAVATGMEPRPVLAECLSTPFRVYGTKDFPGVRLLRKPSLQRCGLTVQ